jgi:lipid-A-disaccharide synthase
MEDHKFNVKGKKVWIFAGEESGDLYGASLAREMTSLAPDLVIEGMGGREMRDSGVEILVDSTELGVVGIVEVLKKYPTFRRVFKRLVRLAKESQPNLIVLIDYPGFNLRFARKMRGLSIKVVYYISPQVWAWGSRRIPKIASLVAKMLVIFPFEVDIYRKVGLEAQFVGHPLVDIMRRRINPELQRDPDLILLLPGSRDSEVDRLLEAIFLTATELYNLDNRFRFVVAVPRTGIKDPGDTRNGRFKWKVVKPRSGCRELSPASRPLARLRFKVRFWACHWWSSIK